MGRRFDKQRAMKQYREMVEVYERKGVHVHYLEADEGLPSSVFARDSSFLTPWGAVIATIQIASRRDFAVAGAFYHEAGIPIRKQVTAGDFECGDFCILKPGVALSG